MEAGEDAAEDADGAAPVGEHTAAEPEQGAEKRMLQSVVEKLVDVEEVSYMMLRSCCPAAVTT